MVLVLGMLGSPNRRFWGVGWEAGLLLQLRGSDQSCSPACSMLAGNDTGMNGLEARCLTLPFHLEARDKEDGRCGWDASPMDGQPNPLTPSLTAPVQRCNSCVFLSWFPPSHVTRHGRRADTASATITVVCCWCCVCATTFPKLEGNRPPAPVGRDKPGEQNNSGSN
jgi:hypothetical protein